MFGAKLRIFSVHPTFGVTLHAVTCHSARRRRILRSGFLKIPVLLHSSPGNRQRQPVAAMLPDEEQPAAVICGEQRQYPLLYSPLLSGCPPICLSLHLPVSLLPDACICCLPTAVVLLCHLCGDAAPPLWGCRTTTVGNQPTDGLWQMKGGRLSFPEP